MLASKFLKAARDESPEKPGEPGEKPETSDTSRIIALTDDELQKFGNEQPGEDLACEVHGTMEGNKFNVLSVSPLNGGNSYGKDMADQVMQRVMPNVAPYPS